MQDFSLLLQITITLLSAAIGGVGWLFKMLFNQNVEMTNRLLELQQKTTRIQTEIQSSLESLQDSQKQHAQELEEIKIACDENNFYQRQISDLLKNQSVLAQLKKLAVNRKRSNAQGLGLSSQAGNADD